jgi:galactonate dehydratase
MKITGYETFEVPPRWLFLRVDTDAGISGWGEPIAEGHAKTVGTEVESIVNNHLLGKDPMEIERHWQAMYRGRHYRGGPILMSAIAGIDQALWDIKGKACDVPVYELLGGKSRDRIRLYQWIGGDTPETATEAATTAVENGYRTLKLAAVTQIRRIGSRATIRESSERLAAVREALGDDIDIAVDFRGRVTKSMAKWLGTELDRYDPIFYEEPVLPEHFDSLSRLDAHTKTPIASGHRLYSRWDFDQRLDQTVVDIVQPDPAHCGGITEAKKIANAAETNDCSATFHCSVGPIAFAACLQLATAVPNTVLQGQNLDIHDPEDNGLLEYLHDPAVFEIESGSVEPPEGPGLGIDVDEDVVRERSRADVDWQHPTWYHEDGSVAEW